jgi:Ca2+-dependent lipid-binding protein
LKLRYDELISNVGFAFNLRHYIMGSREKVEWLNAILQSMWPHIDATASDIIEGLVEPLLKESLKASGVRGITLGFQEFNLGTTAPRVEYIQAGAYTRSRFSST